jgi:plasmid stabilization system protein ParE
MRVVIDESAIADIDRLAAWIAKDSPQRARATVRRILATIERLNIFPELGHKGVDEIYQRVVSDTAYIVVYEIRQRPSAVIVIAVVHGARDR